MRPQTHSEIRKHDLVLAARPRSGSREVTDNYALDFEKFLKARQDAVAKSKGAGFGKNARKQRRL